MNLASLDIKLLIVFDAVMRERSVTRAAVRVGMSQPAVSSALNRLRDLVRDTLFLRVAGGVRPTPRAEELALPVQQALRQLQYAFEPPVFAPETARRSYTIAASDHASTLVLPALASRIFASARGIQLKILPKFNPHILMQMDSGEVDFGLGVIHEMPQRFRHQTLFRERYVCFMRPDHPLAAGALTFERYIEAHHLTVAPLENTGQLIDRLLARRNAERHVAMTVNQSLLAPDILRGTDLILTTLRMLAARVPAFAGLSVRPLPFLEDPVEVRLTWHGVQTNDPSHRWMREQIVDVCAAIDPETAADPDDAAAHARRTANPAAQASASAAAPSRKISP